MVTRKPIITVLGHVDHGKTSLLDAIRGTSTVEKEPGAITQHIASTEISIDLIKKNAKELLEQYKFELKITGLLLIDTPGHEAFTNLRKRGGSIADIAILVIDINQGIQAQTIEAIEILKSYKTPFIVAANKIDLIRGWDSKNPSLSSALKEKNNATSELDNKIYELVGKLWQYGFNSERFDRVDDFTKQVSIIPCSAKTKQGIPEILMFLSGLSQKFLEENLKIEVSGAGKASVLEVKEEKGIGTTIDVILYDGTIKIKDTIVLMGKNGIIETSVKALLEPTKNPAKEKYTQTKEAIAATGIKIVATGLEEAIPGSSLFVKTNGKETEMLLQEAGKIVFETNKEGICIKADSLGSLEAITKLFTEKEITIRKTSIGEITKKDVTETTAAMEAKENAQRCGIIIAFNIKIQPEAEKEAIANNIKIIQNNVIYNLVEETLKTIEEEKKADTEKKIASMAFPAKVIILPNCIFRKSKPLIIGIKVLEGKLTLGAQLMNKGNIIGKIEEIQKEGKNQKEAKEKEEVAISIPKATWEKQAKENDELLTFIPEKQLQKIEEIPEIREKYAELISEIKKMQKSEIKNIN